MRSARGRAARRAPIPTPEGLPAEHGFRFFPAFYRHLPDTMARIPSGGGQRRDRLVGAERILFARAGGANELVAPAHAPESLADLRRAGPVRVRRRRRSSACPRSTSRGCSSGCSRCWPPATSGGVEQWDRQSWWDYVQADRRSEAFRTLPRRRADAHARRGAGEGDERAHRRADPRAAAAGPLARGRASRPRARRADLGRVDRRRGWRICESRGVTLRLGAPVEGLALRNGRIAIATVGGREPCAADFYVAALPVEVMRTLLSPELRARRAAPERPRPPRHALDERDPVLPREDLPLVRGHAIYLDSEWALTSISQRQFWRDVARRRRRVGGILSVDISEWQRAGPLTGKVAALCTPRGDPRRGLGAAAGPPRRRRWTASRSRSWFLDEAIEFPNPSGADQRRAAAGQHDGLVGRPAGRGDRDPEPRAGRRLRAHVHGPGDDGGRERGGAPRGQRDPRRRRARARRRCGVWPLREPPALGPRRALDKRALAAAPPAGFPVRVSPSGER